MKSLGFLDCLIPCQLRGVVAVLEAAYTSVVTASVLITYTPELLVKLLFLLWYLQNQA